MAAAQAVGFVGAGLELGFDGQRDLERERGDGREQQVGDGGVDTAAGHGQTATDASFDGFGDALVVGHLDAAAGVVPHGHAAPAAAADHEALQQRGSLTRRSPFAVAAVRGGVGGQRLLVGLELFEIEVAGVRVGDQRGPLVAWQRRDGGFAVGPGVGATPPEAERAGVARVVQHA